MVLRLLVTAVFLAVMLVIGISDTEFGPKDDPWVTLVALALPLLAGLAIGRSWALVLALSPLPLYAIDQDTGDLAPGFAITAGIVMLAVPLAIGVLIRRFMQRSWDHRREHRTSESGGLSSFPRLSCRCSFSTNAAVSDGHECAGSWGSGDERGGCQLSKLWREPVGQRAGLVGLLQQPFDSGA